MTTTQTQTQTQKRHYRIWLWHVSIPIDLDDIGRDTATAIVAADMEHYGAKDATICDTETGAPVAYFPRDGPYDWIIRWF